MNIMQRKEFFSNFVCAHGEKILTFIKAFLIQSSADMN